MFVRNTQNIQDFDPEIWALIQYEQNRQENALSLIASENYASPAVIAALGTILTNKYAEGYSGKRYYGGCCYIDEIEALAINRAKNVFDACYANVQPHSGSQANAAAYLALLNPGDTILGMNLSMGGHLTHGSQVSFSGKIYKSYQYGVLDNGEIDYEEVRTLAKKYHPKAIMSGFSAYSAKANWQLFREIADEVGAFLIADIAHVAGEIAAKIYPSPVNIADITTLTTHKTLRGPRGGMILAKNNTDLEKKINSAVFPGTQGGPLMHVIAAKAIALKEAATEDFANYQKQVVQNAKTFANYMLNRGFKVIGQEFATHMFLVDLRSKNLTGKKAEDLLTSVDIIVNKNMVPHDSEKPTITSGIRIGTPSLTTRGFKEKDIELLAGLLCNVLENPTNNEIIAKTKKQVADLCHSFKIYK